MVQIIRSNNQISIKNYCYGYKSNSMRFNNLMESSSACSYVATQRGGVALLFEGHRYNKVRDGKDGTVYWRCSRDRQCPGRAVTVNNRNLASSNYSNANNSNNNNNNNNNSSHLLLPPNNNSNNNPLFHQSANDFSQAMNLSSSTNNVDNTLYSSLNNQFNLINHQNVLESSFKMNKANSSPPPPSSNPLSHNHHNQLLNKSSYHQYNKLLRNKYTSSSSQQQQQQQSKNNPFEALNRLALPNSPLNTHSSSTMVNMKSESPTSRPSSTSSFSMMNTPQNSTTNDATSMAANNCQVDPLAIQLQDAFQEAHAAAFAAAAFPSLLNETFKFLSATAATNPQMAAALTQTLYNQNLLKNFDLTMATATAAAVVAASNNNNSNNENQSDRSIDKCQLNHLSIDPSPFVSLGRRV
ncbi:FLYWCH zinc finger domain containing protein [Euroglyphus maynei]|uniref:FLYWCH zinc finger domain containing protein n=1 Tax=Euroglyphus maynei TaxID=6958 RepID=A0A1Y3BPJ3_EURMA|nr:FLYWCH zinc finger domain containing protein [Euroglyphus maynei]